MRTFFEYELEAMKRISQWGPINFEGEFSEEEIAAISKSRYGLHLQNSIVIHPSRSTPKSIRITIYLGNTPTHKILQHFFENITLKLLVKVNR